MSITHAQRQAVATVPAPIRALTNVLVISGLTIAVLASVVLAGLGGWDYYTTPLAERGYSSTHQLLRPAGRVAHLFGVAGFLMVLVPVVYSVRKNVRRFRDVGSMKTWLNVHVFCGIVGPAFVTFHTAFKFNGIVSVAYWSMVAVVLSGFVGRYLYVRIPRSIRGLELTQAELDARARELGEALAAAALPEQALAEIDAFERRISPAEDRLSYLKLFLDESRMRREITRFRHTIDREGAASALRHDIVDVAAERATLARRMVYLKKTKKLFDLWHVFHMPLVYVMFAIVSLHVAVTMYMGYVPFMD